MDARYNLPPFMDLRRNDSNEFHFPPTSRWPSTGALPPIEVKAEDDNDVQNNNGHEGTTSSPCDFVKKLYRILEDQSIADIISWGPKGDRFEVKDINEFAKVVLPRTFKHSNFSSFVRQLNKYDFHKVKEMDDSFEDGEEHWTYRHPEFHTNGRDALENIKRKAPGQRARNFGTSPPPSPLDSPCNALASMQNELSSLGAAHEQVLCHVRDLERNYRDVLVEMLCFQRCMAQQDGIMQNLMRYLRDNDVGQSKLRASRSFSAESMLIFHQTPCGSCRKMGASKNRARPPACKRPSRCCS
ncbi:HSF-type DNA-binding-domain-containing protein [Mycena polygramma]|nr:HSF-type DNA-binding-domain-containing protein [Mycena polygramma]